MRRYHKIFHKILIEGFLELKAKAESLFISILFFFFSNRTLTSKHGLSYALSNCSERGCMHLKEHLLSNKAALARHTIDVCDIALKKGLSFVCLG